MSGGFFRGTSADQDTRFSNKQAKLLKTQKFAPELDHMVDMTRVKMDVMRPWIATRVTELLGFEDEVLINFIYGLLDGKEVDGKQIQIQLTGFMEKNTVKFMKELWGLLLSAQQNASGVPQQFLDAKEAEIQQRKAEDARIAQEIQNKREKDGRDIEMEKPRRMDGDAGNSRFDGVTLGSASDNVNAEEEQSKHSSRTKNREGRRLRSISLSPHAGRRSLSPRRRSPSPSRHSHSSERRHRSSRRSISPRKRSVSPQRHSPRSTPSMSRRRSPYSRRRSPSVTRYRSPSPRRRSPHTRRKSPYFVRRRSPSPYRRWSPAHASRRSPFPPRRRSPVRRRPSPARHCSPSPARRRPRSPVRRRSQSPYHPPQSRSPKRRRRSPHSPRSRAANRRLSPRRRSVSPYNSSSPSSPRRSLSRYFDRGTNGVPSNKDRDVLRRNQEISHDDDMNDTEITGHPNEKHNYVDTKSHRSTKSLRSPQHEARDQKAINNKRHSGYSLVQPDSPSVQRDSTQNRPVKSSGKHLPSQDSMDTSGDEEEGIRARENARKANSSRRKTKDSSTDLQLKKVRADDSSPGEKSPLRSARRYTQAIGGHPGNPGASREREQQSGKDFPKKHDGRLLESSEEEERDGRKMKRQTDSPDDSCVKQRSPRRVAKDDTYSKDGISNEHGEKSLRDAAYDATTGNKHSAEVDKLSQSDDEASPVRKIKNRTDGNTYMDSGSSGSEDPEKYRSHVERRRHRKSHKHKKHHDDSSESDSEPNDKESRKRRKEEKKLRKEEKRRRREERHRRRSERHASKQKLKHIDTVTPPSDLDKDHESDSDDAVRKKGSSRGGREEESEQKKLEIELREKALESLRAKKAINH